MFTLKAIRLSKRLTFSKVVECRVFSRVIATNVVSEVGVSELEVRISGGCREDFIHTTIIMQ